MLRSAKRLMLFRPLFIGALALSAVAVPSPAPVERGLITGIVGGLAITTESALNSTLTPLINGLTEDGKEFTAIVKDILTALLSVVPVGPNGIQQGLDELKKILLNNQPLEIIKSAGQLILNGFTPADLKAIINGLPYNPTNSASNNNKLEPVNGVNLAKAGPNDGEFRTPLSVMRQAIYIPTSFSATSKRRTVILVPGTGGPGGQTFSANLIKLLPTTSFAQVVWLNLPGNGYADASIAGEYTAYAINYIAGITNRSDLAVASWSQGSLDTTWALKYFPSTQSKVTDFVAFSPDLHGTDLAYAFCPAFPKIPCPPAILQQEYNSRFVATLRANGGDQAFVPTTTIYSIEDEIVQPQTGTGASGYVKSSSKAPASNNEVQSTCGVLTPAAGVVTHEGILYNPLAYALLLDALTHDGPGQVSRIDIPKTCSKFVTDGLSLADLLETEALFPSLVVRLLTYPDKVLVEPTLPSYASY